MIGYSLSFYNYKKRGVEFGVSYVGNGAKIKQIQVF